MSGAITINYTSIVRNVGFATISKRLRLSIPIAWAFLSFPFLSQRMQEKEFVMGPSSSLVASSGLLPFGTILRPSSSSSSSWHLPRPGYSLCLHHEVADKKAPSLRTSSLPCAMAMPPSQLGTESVEYHGASPLRTEQDLLVIGPGVLGRIIAQGWMKEFSGCKIVGQTRTTEHHEELEALGIHPVVKDKESHDVFPNVVFCAPPSGSNDYAAELSLAAQRWNKAGVFLFTSSSAVYDCSDNNVCDEETSVVPLGRSPRTDILLRAEEEVLKAGGSVVRLAGLYKSDRGAHIFWLNKQVVEARPDHIINLIHYEDAASLCITILKKGFKGKIFMGCDGSPLSRGQIMEIVNKSGKFQEKFNKFTGTTGPLGKKMNNSKTRKETGWEPKFPSYSEFIMHMSQ